MNKAENPYAKLSTASLDAPAGIKREVRAFEASSVRTERVILVDDDSGLRGATQQILEELGFEVEAFANGQQAIEAITRDNRPISLLLTDYNMPGLTGYQLAQLVRAKRPDIPILIASGSAEEVIRADFDQTLRPPFLQKPYSLRGLAHKVREILDLVTTDFSVTAQ